LLGVFLLQNIEKWQEMAIVSVRTRGILQILGFLCYLKGGFQLSDIGRSSALPEAWIQ
jgi:hypothetical protein